MVSLDFMRDRIRRGSQARIRLASPELLHRLQADVPVAEDGGGTMRDSITVDPNGLRVEVLVDVEYATYVIEGTPSHPITPNGHPYLAFFWDGPGAAKMGKLPDGRVLSKGVMHPGTTANDWYHPVLDDWPRILESTPA